MSDGTIKFFGRIKNGIMRLYKPDAYKQAIDALEGKEFALTLSERFVDTTIDQHAYYRSTNRWLIDNTEAFGGWEEENVHEFAVSMFLTHKRYVQFQGEAKEIIVAESTATIGKKRMREFIDKWIAWLATEQEITVPTSEEMLVGKYKSEKK